MAIESFCFSSIYGKEKDYNGQPTLEVDSHGEDVAKKIIKLISKKLKAF